MLEFNKWFFVLLLNFLVLIYILNIILFRPMVKLFTDRESTVRNSLDAAKELSRRKEESIATMNRELKEAISKANGIFEGIRKEGLEKQKELLEGANKQAQEFIGKAKKELQAEAGKARQRLRGDAEKFAEEIVRKLAGI
ncbi:MAG: hypothetical protein M1497_11480 [Nitrospirae bacterium]|nr:hypothetical protein [Nitrospirota bacterium]